MKTYSWTCHYINTPQDIDTIEDVVKKAANTKFHIQELKFKDQSLLVLLQAKIKEKFLKLYSYAINPTDAVDRLFNTDLHTWITPYGTIKLTVDNKEPTK